MKKLLKVKYHDPEKQTNLSGCFSLNLYLLFGKEITFNLLELGQLNFN